MSAKPEFDPFGLKAANDAQERMARMARANWLCVVAAILATRQPSNILDIDDALQDATVMMNKADERCGMATIVAIKDVLEDGLR